MRRFVTAAASIGSPLDLAAGGAALGRGFNMIYTRMFLATLKSKALAKLQQFPDIARDGDYTRQAAQQPQPVRVRQRVHRAAARLPQHRGLLGQSVGQTVAASRAHSVPGAQCAQ